MLTAAVCGKVFASPSSSQVFSAILATQSQNIILIVKNYTGDRLQFGKAAERARRELHAQNVRVEMLIVDDDCAIQNTKRVGRRGLCGTLFIHKILGWLSTTTSYDLDVMVGIGKNIINSTRTIGVALSSCTIPGQEPMFEMPSDSMELGLGIHGESGYLCTQRPSTSAEIVSACLDKLMQDQTLKLTRGDRVAVLLNNFGGCTMLEMGVLIADVLKDFGKIGAGE